MKETTFSFTLYGADCRGNAKNTLYPHRYKIHNLEDFLKMADRDFVCAEYANNWRSSANFIGADCICMDCDNSHSDNPKEWKTLDDVKAAFPDVPFLVHYSRNHMKVKDGKDPRPKFHVIMPIEPVQDDKAYSRMKEQMITVFPQFDPNALDSGRFLFGTENPQGESISGNGHLEEIIKEVTPSYWWKDKKQDSRNTTDNIDGFPDEIPEGHRNATMHEYALSVLTRLSDTSAAYISFLKVSERCVPPLDDSELASIWHSALHFFNERIRTQPGYMDPVKYGVISDFKFIDSKKDVFTMKEFLESDEHDSWLIKDFVYKGPHLQYLFGESGSGKSFVAIDMGLSIAYGLERWFFDKRITQGKVLYFCGEGINGVRKRIRAWKLFHEIKEDSENFCIYTNSWEKLNREGTILNISERLRTQVDGGFIPDLVIIDTQARFTEGDENKQIDADSYINAFNSLAAVFNANIMVVHHTSKSNGETLKGSVNFKGASDMDVRITKFGDEGIKVSHEKNKDGEELKGKILRFETVNLEMDENGDIITSLVLSDKNLSGLPAASESEKAQNLADLDLMREFWESSARLEDGKWVFNRLDCIEYLKNDGGWTHKKAVQETHAPNKGLFSRLKENRIILNPEPVGDAPKKGKNAKPQDYVWTICDKEADNLGLLGNDLKLENG